MAGAVADGALRVALVGFGSRGDLYPLLAVGRGLRDRGHDVTVLEHEEYRTDAESAGLPFRPLGPGSACQDAFDVASRGALALRRLARAAAAGATPDAVAAIYAGCPHVVLAHPFQYAGRLAAEAIGVPLLSVCGPDIADLFHPPPDAPADELRRGARSLQVIDRIAGPALDAARQGFGLSPLPRAATIGALSETGVLVTTSRLYHPSVAHWPTHLAAAGYPAYDGGRDDGPPAAVAEFAAGEGPLVVCTLGDSSSEELPAVLAELSGVVAALGGRTLHLGGRALPPGAGDRTLVHPFVPLRHVLPNTALVVHHGGRGTTLAALRAGVPSLMVPRWLDGFANARLAAELGAGRVVPADLGADGLREAVADLLREDAYRLAARAAGEVLATDPDAAEVADACLRRVVLPGRRGLAPCE